MQAQANHRHKPDVGYLTQVYVDETDEIAVEKAAPHLRKTYEVIYYSGPSGQGTEYHASRNQDEGEIARNIMDMDFLLERSLVLVGSPETVTKKVRAAAEEGLFNTLMCELNIGTLGEEDLMRSIRLFGTQVIPALREFGPY